MSVSDYADAVSTYAVSKGNAETALKNAQDAYNVTPVTRSEAVSAHTFTNQPGNDIPSNLNPTAITSASSVSATGYSIQSVAELKERIGGKDGKGGLIKDYQDTAAEIAASPVSGNLSAIYTNAVSNSLYLTLTATIP